MYLGLMGKGEKSSLFPWFFGKELLNFVIIIVWAVKYQCFSWVEFESLHLVTKSVHFLQQFQTDFQ